MSSLSWGSQTLWAEAVGQVVPRVSTLGQAEAECTGTAPVITSDLWLSEVPRREVEGGEGELKTLRSTTAKKEPREKPFFFL